MIYVWLTQSFFIVYFHCAKDTSRILYDTPIWTKPWQSEMVAKVLSFKVLHVVAVKNVVTGWKSSDKWAQNLRRVCPQNLEAFRRPPLVCSEQRRTIPLNPSCLIHRKHLNSSLRFQLSNGKCKRDHCKVAFGYSELLGSHGRKVWTQLQHKLEETLYAPAS